MTPFHWWQTKGWSTIYIYFFALFFSVTIQRSISANNTCCQSQLSSDCERSFEAITSEQSADTELRESRKVCLCRHRDIHHIKITLATLAMHTSRQCCQCYAASLSIDGWWCTAIMTISWTDQLSHFIASVQKVWRLAVWKCKNKKCKMFLNYTEQN